MLATSIQQTKFSIQSGSTSLAAVLTVASPTGPLVVFAHGFAGDKTENGLFTQAKDYFVRNGFSVLRFDFRACGENSGTFRRVRLHDLVSDLESVFTYIKSARSLQPLPIGLVGFSLGAGIGLLAKLPVETFVFWSPAIYTRSDMVPRYQTDVDQKGYVIKGNIKVSKEFIDDLNSDSIPNSLLGVNAPVLLIHGTDDQRIPHTSSESAADVLRHTSKETHLVIIPGADHSFRGGYRSREHVFSASVDWLREHLPQSNRDASNEQSVGDWRVDTHGHLAKRSHSSGTGPFIQPR